MKIIYMGPKKSTIENSNFFDGSITLFDKVATFEYWNPDNIPLEVSIYNKELEKISEPTKVMAHNPHIGSKCKFPKNISLICQNSLSLLEDLDNKIKTRQIIGNSVPMLDYLVIKGDDFNYSKLSHDLSSDLVIQLPIGSGGAKTFLCNPNNAPQITPLLIPDADYSVSEYKKDNVPYNIHCIIASNQIEILPPSKQLLEISEKIEYFGSDFDIQLNPKLKIKFLEYSRTICRILQKLGYRGVLGIDYIYTENELYFIEINPRFQGSSRQVDALLKDSNLPSIFDYNYRSFYNLEIPTVKKIKSSIF